LILAFATGAKHPVVLQTVITRQSGSRKEIDMGAKTLTKPFLALVWILLGAYPATAADTIEVVVKTIQASGDRQYTDPRLSSAIEELQSVFRYSSYRLLSEDTMTLKRGQTGKVTLPGGRELSVTPKGTTNGRIALGLRISKAQKEIFQTQVQLLNRGSIIVGGPKHGAGTLLFRIFAAH
jgi:hypothetical protein